MNEDIMRAIEQVAAQATNDQERVVKEAYINTVVSRTLDVTRSFLATGNAGLPEPTYSVLEKWQELNKGRIALQIGEVMRILLRKELLGE